MKKFPQVIKLRADKKQERLLGYFLNINFDYDKRNQKFQTNDGFRSRYLIDFPL